MADGLAAIAEVLARFDARLAAIEQRMGVSPPAAAAPAAGSAAAAASTQDDDLPQYIADFDALCAQHLTPLVEAAHKLGGNGAALGDILKASFDGQRSLLVLGTKAKKPDPAKLLENQGSFIREHLQQADQLIVRNDPFEFHAKAVKEALSGAQWTLAGPGPQGLIEAARDGADFWLNKVRTSTKGTDDAATHVAFANGVKNLYNALYALVKEEFKMGLTWNPKGVDISAAPATAAAPAPAPAPAPAAAKPAGGNLFAELRSIDQSSGRTAGLRQVTKDMKSKSAGGVVSSGAAKKPAAAAKPAASAAAKPVKPPRTELTGKRWFVENYVDGGVVTVSDVQKTHEVYVYNCKNTTIVVEGKCNALQVDKAVSCQVVFDAAVSTAGLVDCKRVKIQVKDRVPSISVDKTDGCVVYLSHASRDTQIVTSKSSEVNVSFPVSDAEDAEWAEQPIPEQFVATVTADGKVDVRVSDLYSG